MFYTKNGRYWQSSPSHSRLSAIRGRSNQCHFATANWVLHPQTSTGFPSLLNLTGANLNRKRDRILARQKRSTYSKIKKIWMKTHFSSSRLPKVTEKPSTAHLPLIVWCSPQALSAGLPSLLNLTGAVLNCKRDSIEERQKHPIYSKIEKISMKIHFSRCRLPKVAEKLSTTHLPVSVFEIVRRPQPQQLCCSDRRPALRQRCLCEMYS